MLGFPKDEFNVGGGYAALVREAGLDAEAVYSHPGIRVWRSVSERENATLDLEVEGKGIRLHAKRFHATGGQVTPAEQEVAGIRLLQDAGVATVPLVAWGRRTDGRSFVITQDLAGFRPADAVLREDSDDRALLEDIAAVAAKLHAAGLHHRDLYLCHFFVGRNAAGRDVRLIDAARVKRLPAPPLRVRWVVKDLAQLWYSTYGAGLDDAGRARLWEAYSLGVRLRFRGLMRHWVEAKARRIARHDARLKRSNPERDVSIAH